MTTPAPKPAKPRSPLRFVNGLSFVDMPADAMGVPRGFLLCPGSGNDDRDPVTGKLFNRQNSMCPPDRARLTTVLNRHAPDAMIVVNVEGGEAFYDFDSAGSHEQNEKAVENWRILLTMVRSIKPRATIIADLPLPFGEFWMGETWKQDPAKVARLSAESRWIIRALTERVVWGADAGGRPICDGTGFQIYFHNRWNHDTNANNWENVPGDPRALHDGWIHQLRSQLWVHEVLGKPTVAIFGPFDAEGEDALTAAEMENCLDQLERHVETVYLWGTAKQGTPIPGEITRYRWDNAAPWVVPVVKRVGG